jgi:hypothetical protein
MLLENELSPGKTTQYYADMYPFAEDATKIYYYITTSCDSATPVYNALVTATKTLSGVTYTQAENAAMFNSGVYPAAMTAAVRMTPQNRQLITNPCSGHKPMSVLHMGFENINNSVYLVPKIFELTIDSVTGKFQNAISEKTVNNPNNLDLRCTIDAGGPFISASNIQLYTQHKLDIMSYQGKRYVIYHNHQRIETTDAYLAKVPELHKIIVYEVIDDDTLEAKSVTQYPTYMYGSMISQDGLRIVQASRSQVFVYTFNEATATFELQKPIDIIPFSTGFDKNGRIFVLDTNYSVWVEDLAEIDDILVEFVDVPEFDRFDTYIDATLRITLRNSIGKVIPAKVKVELTGACYFSDMTKTKSINIDSTGKTEMMVKLTESTAYNAVVTKIN